MSEVNKIRLANEASEEVFDVRFQAQLISERRQVWLKRLLDIALNDKLVLQGIRKRSIILLFLVFENKILR